MSPRARGARSSAKPAKGTAGRKRRGSRRAAKSVEAITRSPRVQRRRRIGITCYSHFGGSGVVATELGLALSRRGYEVHFIAHRLPFRLRHFASNVYFHEVTSARLCRTCP